jgi:hypothetical protein
MSPRRGSTPRQTDWLTVSRIVTLTLRLKVMMRKLTPAASPASSTLSATSLLSRSFGSLFGGAPYEWRQAELLLLSVQTTLFPCSIFPISVASGTSLACPCSACNLARSFSRARKPVVNGRFLSPLSKVSVSEYLVFGNYVLALGLPGRRATHLYI